VWVGTTVVLAIFCIAGCIDKTSEVCTGVVSASSELVVDKDCAKDTFVESLTACLASAGPDECVEKIESGARLCDGDGDGLADDLEAALTRAYAPVFAFNGGAFGGNPETHWPGNAAQFVSRAKLTFGKRRTIVDDRPTLDALAAATSNGHSADNPCPGEGSDFWLCLTDSSESTRVTSLASMRALPGGIDVLSIAHPANGALSASSHVFVSYGLFFPFNAHSTVDDHEGDWESIAVFVNRRTGTVDAAWFDRHNTVDNERLIASDKYPPRDAATESPHGTVSSGSSAPHGLRFADYAGARRRVVGYVSTGGHALYDYPANTRIFTYGPRDTHSGDGPKIVVGEGRVANAFGATEGDALEVGYVNPGESSHITLPWARFRGQWGCTDGRIAKSWPGPFGNARHPRPMFERTWGSPPSPPSPE